MYDVLLRYNKAMNKLKRGKNGIARPSSKRLRWLTLIMIVLTVVFVGLLGWLLMRDANRTSPAIGSGDNASQSEPEEPLAGVPELSATTIVDGKDHVWGMAFLPSGELLFGERKGVLSVYTDGKTAQVSAIQDVRAKGEGGLLGIAVDPKFEQNRYIYTCFNSTKGADGLDIRVVRWRLGDDLKSLGERKDIVTGITSNPSGRHSGCQLAFGPDGNLWVATGDAAMAETPQDPASLNGKVLRVDRDGKAASQDNLSGEFDPRIYSYGHRNLQGLAFSAEPRAGAPGVSVEHGPNINDEVNALLPGNFGWDPVPGRYNESVPMTDTKKYPDAIKAVWSSGDPTQAPSGAAFVYGKNWRDWNGALAVSQLKNKRIKFLFFDDNWKLTGQKDMFVNKFGRLRAAVLDPNGNLFVSTDNGGADKIIRIAPR